MLVRVGKAFTQRKLCGSGFCLQLILSIVSIQPVLIASRILDASDPSARSSPVLWFTKNIPRALTLSQDLQLGADLGCEMRSNQFGGERSTVEY